MLKELNSSEDTNGGWVSWRNHVLIELERINENVEKLADSDTDIRIDIGRLKLCSALWGGVGGMIVGAVITSFVILIFRMV